MKVTLLRIASVRVATRRSLRATASVAWAALFGLLIAQPAVAESAKIDPAVVSFLETYCVQCHGPEDQNASLRFDAMPVGLGDEATAQRWQDILDVLNLDQMPPEGETRPGDEELSQILATLTKNLGEARERLNAAGGNVVLRRLNRREYQNTIRELFGVDVSIDSVPQDATVDGFDTIGAAHSFSSLHLERYLDTGGSVVGALMKRRGRRKPETTRFDFGPGQRKELEDSIALRKSRGRGRPLTDQERRARDEKGDTFDRGSYERMQLSLLEEYVAHPASKAGDLLPFRGLVKSTTILSPMLRYPGVYKVRIRCGVDAPRPVDGVFLEVRRGPRKAIQIDQSAYYEVRGTIDEPQIIEFETVVDGTVGNYFAFARRTPRTELPERFHEYVEKDPNYVARVGTDILDLADDEVPSVWLDWIETEGPFPQFEGALDPSVVALPRRGSTDDEARQMIETVAYEAFRHSEPPAEFLDRTFAVYQTLREHGADTEKATRECLKIVLASPSFLFLYEPSVEGEKRPLTDRELAVRLSYFLWSGPPDEQLYEAAAAGELSEPGGLSKQLDRMLKSDKAEEFVVHFVTQFFELDRLDAVNPDAVDSPDYDLPLQAETKRETIAFFRDLLREDRPATDMIDADYVVVNALLADFYGLPGVRGDEYRAVPLPPDSPRGGLLGQSAILTLTGTGERTSPVERGAFVLRKILDNPPPPAPANVPMLEESSLGNQSIRETLAAHMTKPQCSSCHRRIDPLGFGLENFDPVGLWRDAVPSADGTVQFAIAPAGVMPDGERRFSSPHEMKRVMLEDRDAFLAGLTKAIMTYGLGRKVGYADEIEVERIVAQTAADGYGLRTLLKNVVNSDSFRTK